MPFMGASYKKFTVYLNNYKNASATAQEISFNFAFTNAPLIVAQPEGLGATATTSKLKLPKEMTEAKTGWLVVEGY